MRSTKQLRGMSIVEVNGGKKLGQADEVVVSPDDLRLLGFVVKSGGLLDQRESIVNAADVRSIGPDAITVDGEETARGLETASREFSAARSSERRLIGNKVVTGGGLLIGTVTDYVIDERTKKVVALTVGNGMLRAGQPVQAERIVSVGPDVIVVDDETARARAG